MSQVHYGGQAVIEGVMMRGARNMAIAVRKPSGDVLLHSEPLPQPDPSSTDPDADLEEPIHLLLTAATRVVLVPQGTVP